MGSGVPSTPYCGASLAVTCSNPPPTSNTTTAANATLATMIPRFETLRLIAHLALLIGWELKASIANPRRSERSNFIVDYLLSTWNPLLTTVKCDEVMSRNRTV